MKCSMWLLEQLKGADADISIVLATSRSLTFGGCRDVMLSSFGSHVPGCQAILHEGKADKRHGGAKFLPSIT